MRRPLTAVAVVLLLGILIIEKWAGSQNLPAFRVRMEEKNIDYLTATLRGRVEDIQVTEKGYALTVKEEGETGRNRTRVYLENVIYEELPGIGSVIKAEGRYFLFPKATNPGQFDTRAYYDAQNITLGYLADSYYVSSSSYGGFRNRLIALRESLRSVLLKADTDFSAVYESLLFGDTDHLDADTEDTFREAGLMRVMKLSGYHITLAAAAVYGLIRKLTGRRGLSAAVTGAGLIVMILMTGGSFACCRAGIVFLLQRVAELKKRKFDVLNAAALSLILLLLKTPGLILTSSVQYYLAVLAGTGILYPLIKDYLFRSHKFYLPAILIFCIQVCLLPVQLLHEYQVSVYAPLVNVLVSPFLPVLMAAGIFGISFSASGLPFYESVSFAFGDGIIGYYRKLSEFLTARLPFAGRVNGCPALWRLILYAAVLFMIAAWFYLALRKRRRTSEAEERRITEKDFRITFLILAAVFYAGLAFLVPDRLKEGTIRITVMDVGQGDGILLETSGTKIMIDGGSSSSDDAGRDILRPVFRFKGIECIDLWILSHPDDDHMNGMLSLMEEGKIKVKQLVLSSACADDEKMPEILAAAETAGASVHFLSASQLFQTGGIEFQVLSPESGGSYEGNERSLVLRASYGEYTMLFTGDIGQETEEKLVRKYGNDLKSDFLKTAHHGSKYSTCEEFLQCVRPDIAVISYGRNNSYGHPADETVQRLLTYAAHLYRTGQEGALILEKSCD